MDKTSKLYAIDIETVSQGKRAKQYTDGQHYKLGNVKDPTKVEAQLEKKRVEASHKHGLAWHTGKIIVVSVVDVFGDEADIEYHGHDESEILARLGEHIKGARLIGKSSKNFDFPFLVGRFMANYLEVPESLRIRNNLFDVDDFFGWSSASGQRGKLDDYAFGIDYPNKPLHGSAVQGIYDTILMAEAKGDMTSANASWKQLTEYCVHDSKVVKNMSLLYWGANNGR